MYFERYVMKKETVYKKCEWEKKVHRGKNSGTNLRVMKMIYIPVE